MASFISNLSSAEKQLGSKQDFITTGSTEEFDYIVEADGHGSQARGSACINFIRSVDWSTLLLTENPINVLSDAIASNPALKHNYLSGSTLSIAKIYKDRIELINVGDSQTAVFIDGKLVYINETHDLCNAVEKERMTFLTSKTKSGIKLCILSPTQIYMKPVNLSVFELGQGTKLTIASTQSMGHCNITGLNPSYMTIPYTLDQQVRVFAWSDGISDMMNLKHDLSDLLSMTVDQLINKYEQRWKQDWIVCADENDITSTAVAGFPDDNYDDISLGMWCNY